MITLDEVRQVARSAHAGQVDKLGRDYYEAHLEPIAEKLAAHGPDAEMAGLLHDVLEDTNVTPDQLRELGVPENVITAIISVSKREGESYDDLIARAAADPLGRLVKLADNERNMESNEALAQQDPDAAARLQMKYERARAQLVAADASSRSTPGTYRVADGSPVPWSDAMAAWVPLAHKELLHTAAHYRRIITYKELSEHVQEHAGIRTNMLLANWIGKLLEEVARRAKSAGEPPLTALCVRQDGTIGPGYARAPKSVEDDVDEDIELYAAKHRLLCYQRYAENLPAGGGEPALSPKVEQKRAERASRRRELPVAKICERCFTQLPATGRCSYCD